MNAFGLSKRNSNRNICFLAWLCLRNARSLLKSLTQNSLVTKPYELVAYNERMESIDQEGQLQDIAFRSIFWPRFSQIGNALLLFPTWHNSVKDIIKLFCNCSLILPKSGIWAHQWWRHVSLTLSLWSILHTKICQFYSPSCLRFPIKQTVYADEYYEFSKFESYRATSSKKEEETTYKLVKGQNRCPAIDWMI